MVLRVLEIQLFKLWILEKSGGQTLGDFYSSLKSNPTRLLEYFYADILLQRLAIKRE